MSNFGTATLVRIPTPQPNLVVGWAAGLLQVWPAEDTTIGAPEADLRREQQRLAS